MTVVLILLVVVLGIACVTAVALGVDRSARAAAWRDIAVERRWNHERRTRQP